MLNVFKTRSPFPTLTGELGTKGIMDRRNPVNPLSLNHGSGYTKEVMHLLPNTLMACDSHRSYDQEHNS